MKHWAYLLFFLSFSLYAQNIVKVRATLIPDTGSFTATSEKARGRLLKRADGFSADRISVFADSFFTENKLRDKHFTQYIAGGEKLPYPRVDITDLQANEGKGKAKLTVNGVTRPISLTYQDRKKFVEASFEVKSSDFNLPKAQYLGIGVEDEVKVTIKYHYEIKK